MKILIIEKYPPCNQFENDEEVYIWETVRSVTIKVLMLERRLGRAHSQS